MLLFGFVWVYMWRLVSRLVDSKTFLNVLRAMCWLEIWSPRPRLCQPGFEVEKLLLLLFVFWVDFSNVLRVLISIDAQHLLASEMVNQTTFMQTCHVKFYVCLCLFLDYKRVCGDVYLTKMARWWGQPQPWQVWGRWGGRPLVRCKEELLGPG